jgi:tetratricopeptide (TPR) repeat protein
MIEGKDAEAEAEVRRALTLDRRSFDAFWLLGRILSEAGRFAEARAALERAVALEPGHGAAYYDLVRSFTIGDGDRMLVEQMLKATTPSQKRISGYDCISPWGRSSTISRISVRPCGILRRRTESRRRLAPSTAMLSCAQLTD